MTNMLQLYEIMLIFLFHFLTETWNLVCTTKVCAFWTERCSSQFKSFQSLFYVKKLCFGEI